MSRFLEAKAKIAELTAQLDVLRDAELSEQVDELRNRIAAFSIPPEALYSTDELGKALGIVADAEGPPAPRKRGPRTVPTKYQLNGHTWTGRGVQPNWFSDALLRGIKKEEMLVAKGAVA